jgi:hypothetical protein
VPENGAVTGSGICAKGRMKMKTESITKWIALAELSCADLKINHIDIIIDQAGNDFSLIPTLASFEFSVQWCSLFTTLPEEILLEDAPLLIRIDLSNTLQRQWLNELTAQFAGSGQLLMLCSAWSFNNLSDYLIRCTDVICGSQEGILRFYDTRIFPVLFSHILDTEQKKTLLRPAIFWSWLDREGQPCQIPGNGSSLKADDKKPRIELSDQQLEKLMCICDVNLLLRHLIVPAQYVMSQEELFSLCYEGMLAATLAGLLLDDEREDFVKKFILTSEIKQTEIS